MINFDSLTLKALLNEITPVLDGARIQKIRQTSRYDLLLTIRNNSKNYNLFVSIKPSFAHICILNNEYKNYRIFDFPNTPPMFCMLLRKYLDNVKIDRVIQPDNERIVELHFTACGELGEKIPLVLALELMGKHSNMILYNSKTKIILGCAHNVGEEKSKERELAGGLPYIYPPKLIKNDISKMSFADFAKSVCCINKTLATWLNESFYNISMPLAKEICRNLNLDDDKTLSEAEIKQLYESIIKVMNLSDIRPSVDSGFAKFSLKPIYENNFETVNEMVDAYFGYNSFCEVLKRKKQSLFAIVNKEIKKCEKFISKLGTQDDTEKKITQYKQTADTLMANLYSINIASEVILNNIYTNENMKITLDNSLSISDNAQKYYRLYAKEKRTMASNKIILTKYREKSDYLWGIKSFIDVSDDMDTLLQIEQELAEFNPAKFANKKVKKEKIHIESVVYDGFEIFIGKNNKQNDHIVSKLSAPEDLWFHVHNDYGSHVLIKIRNKNMPVPDEVLLQAAKYAARYSARSLDNKVNVIYTKRKYVRKPPNANLGYVTYTNEREITVEL